MLDNKINDFFFFPLILERAKYVYLRYDLTKINLLGSITVLLYICTDADFPGPDCP